MKKMDERNTQVAFHYTEQDIEELRTDEEEKKCLKANVREGTSNGRRTKQRNKIEKKSGTDHLLDP